MFTFAQILVSLGAIITVFFSHTWAWVILGVTLFLFCVAAVSVKVIFHPQYRKEVSPTANRLLRRWYCFYGMPTIGRDLGSACMTLAYAAPVVGIVGCFRHFYIGLLIAVGFYFIAFRLARMFNPTYFLTDAEEKRAHDELCLFMEAERKEWGGHQAARQKLEEAMGKDMSDKILAHGDKLNEQERETSVRDFKEHMDKSTREIQEKHGRVEDPPPSS